MSDLERAASRTADGLRVLLSRIGGFALSAAKVAFVIGVATFATGWWVFDGSRPAWLVIGGIICVAPFVAALVAWYRVQRTMRFAPSLLGDVRTFMNESRDAADTVLIYDSDERLIATSRNYAPLRARVEQRRKDLPALWAGLRAVTTLPALAAIAILGTLAVGALGTILLIGGLID
jgi:hypothetical protein